MGPIDGLVPSLTDLQILGQRYVRCPDHPEQIKTEDQPFCAPLALPPWMYLALQIEAGGKLSFVIVYLELS